jgi:drug/metabolite transporter (DMT)-like permease
VHGPGLPQTGGGWGAIGAMALVSTVLPIRMFLVGLGRVGPSAAATLSTVEPVVTVLLATLFLHEALHPLQVLGGLCILVAVVVLARGVGREPLDGPS